MKLRIIAGELKNRTLVLSKSAAHFRPTKEIVREAIASSLSMKVRDASVVDLCAGSGAMGFELLSRGAARVHFVENNKRRCEKIQQYAELFKVDNRCNVIHGDVRSFLKNSVDLYDIIYFDPPYLDTSLTQYVPKLFSIASKDGIVLFEHGKVKRTEAKDYSEQETAWQRVEKKFGDTLVDIYTQKDNLKP